MNIKNIFFFILYINMKEKLKKFNIKKLSKVKSKSINPKLKSMRSKINSKSKKYGGASPGLSQRNYRSILREAKNIFDKLIDPRYSLTINISDSVINIIIEVKPIYNTNNYHHHIDNINGKGTKMHDKSLGRLMAYCDKDERTADIPILQAGFWVPERLGEKPNPLAGSGIGKFLMIIFDWICKQLNISVIELDNNTKQRYTPNGKRLPSYYTKFGFRKKNSEEEPEMIKNKNSPKLNTDNMLMSLRKYNPTEYWEWQFN